MTKANAIHELKLHRMMMSMIRIVKNTRYATCEHCEALLRDVHKCMNDELNDIRNRDNHDK